VAAVVHRSGRAANVEPERVEPFKIASPDVTSLASAFSRHAAYFRARNDT
jgi:hypothetical protein